MKSLRMLIVLVVVATLMCMAAEAQQFCQALPPACADQGSWSPAINSGVGTLYAALLLTDGRVMAQWISPSDSNSLKIWYVLTPDSAGGYSNPQPQWQALPSLDTVWNNLYAPAGFTSAVLADGRVVIQGGENNINNDRFTNKGAIFDPNPLVNSWSRFYGPPSWPHIGDGQNVVLPNGYYMVAACGAEDSSCSQQYQQAILNPSNLLLWDVLTTSQKNDPNDEEGYTLLPGLTGKVLTIDTQPPNNPAYELFDWTLSNPTWTTKPLCVGQNGVCQQPPQYIYLYGGVPNGNEIGPAVVLQDGTVLATGAAKRDLPGGQQGRPGATAIYDPIADGWTATDNFCAFQGQGRNPNNYLGMGDEAAVLLPNGNVLLAVHDAVNGTGTYYPEIYQVSQPINQRLCSLTTAPSALTNSMPNNAIDMLLLPTGQVLFTEYNTSNPKTIYWIYTPPAPTGYSSTVQPLVSGAPLTLTHGTTYTLTGQRFNGVSQANMFGDEYENATNYPIVRFTYAGGSPVVYLRTHDHNTMAIATGSFQTTTKVDIPSTMATGPGSLVVIANGIPSAPALATIQ